MRSVSKKHAFIFCMRSVSVTLKTTLDFEYMCCQRDIAKKKYLWSLEFVLRSEMRECVRENHFACQVCVCVCVCVFPVLLSCDNAILSFSVVDFMHVVFAAGSAWLCVRSTCWFSVKQLASFCGRNACKYRYTNSIQTAVLCLIISYFMDTVTIAWWEITIRWIACFGV